MAAPKVIVGAEDRDPKQQALVQVQRTSTAWGVLWWIGAFLLLAGLVDLVLAFYPPRLGQADWRFAVTASVANGLPLPMVGLLASTMAALGAQRPGRARFAQVVNGLMVVFLLVLTVVFLASAGPTLALTPPEVRVGTYKAIVKTVVFFVTFGAASGVAVAAVARWLRTGEA